MKAFFLLLTLLSLLLCRPVLAQSGSGSVQVPVSLSAAAGPMEFQPNWWVVGDLSSDARSVTPSLNNLYSYLYVLEASFSWTYDAVYNGVVVGKNLHNTQNWTLIRKEEGPHIWPKNSPALEMWDHSGSFNAQTLFDDSHASEGGVSYTLKGLRFRYRLTAHLIYFEAGFKHSVGSGVWEEPASQTHAIGAP